MAKRKVSEIPAAAPKAPPAPIAPAAAVRPLTNIQELLVDQLGNIILQGGKQDEVELLIQAALLHQWRLRLSAVEILTEEKITVEAYEHASSWAQDWTRQLIQSWQQSAASSDPDATPDRNITELLREDVRGRLESRFEEFLAAAIPEEIRFLESVLADWDSSSLHSIDELQLEIANSFEREIGRNVRYVRVPWKLRDKVISFVELLTKAAA